MLKTSQSGKFLRLALFSTLFAFLLTLISAYSRLSDAGLGCPDWPGCYGRLFAPASPQDVADIRLIKPRVVDEEEKAFKETLQRYISGTLGLLIIRVGYLGWTLKKRYRRQQVILPGLAVALVFGQTILGALTIKLQFKPVIVMIHLLLGMVTVALLWWVVLREQRFWRSVYAQPQVLRALRPRVLVALVLVAVQISLGGWTSANYASLACPDFPTCQGQWWPPADYVAGLTLWRDVGIDYESRLLNLEATTAIHLAHRLMGIATFLYVGWLSLYTMRIGLRDRICRYGVLMLVTLLAAAALGVMDVVMHLPLVVAVAHNAAATLLLLSVITLNHIVRPRKMSTA